MIAIVVLIMKNQLVMHWKWSIVNNLGFAAVSNAYAMQGYRHEEVTAGSEAC